jgi:ATP-dependent DNA ligase
LWNRCKPSSSIRSDREIGSTKSSSTVIGLWRCAAAAKTRIPSRNRNDLGKKFTEVKDSIAALKVQDVLIDGEIVALDDEGRSSFQLLQAFDMGQERPPIVFYAFDLLQLNGKDLRKLPVEDRKAQLEALLKKSPGVLDIRPPSQKTSKSFWAERGNWSWRA